MSTEYMFHTAGRLVAGENSLHCLAVAASKVTRLMDNNPKTMSVEGIEKVYRKLLP